MDRYIGPGTAVRSSADDVLLCDNFAIGGSSEIESRGLARKDVICGEFFDPRATRMLRHGVVLWG